MLHNMKLQPEPFEMIKCGQKTYVPCKGGHGHHRQKDASR